MGFSILIIVLFISFSVFTYNEVSNLQQSIKDSNNKVAREELLSTAHDAEQDIQGHALDFSLWEEVRQQLSNPLYYAYWREHRALQAGILPKYILDTNIYDKQGNVLSKLDTTSLPLSIDTTNLTSYIEIKETKPELIVTQEIYEQSDDSHIIGYVMIRADLHPELILSRQFNYIDRKSIHVILDKAQRLSVAEFVNHLKFELRPNSMMDEIMNIVIGMLSRMALIIGIPTLLLYPLVTFFNSPSTDKNLAAY